MFRKHANISTCTLTITRLVLIVFVPSSKILVMDKSNIIIHSSKLLNGSISRKIKQNIQL